METLGLATDNPLVVNGGQRTPAEIASEISDYSSQAARGAKWIFIILSSTALNAVLNALDIKVHFIFGMVIPLIPQIMGNAYFAKNLLAFAAGAWLLAGGIYLLFFCMWRVALKGRAWPSYMVLIIYLADLFIYIQASNWLEVACHVIAIWFVTSGLVGAILLRRRLATLRTVTLEHKGTELIARAS